VLAQASRINFSTRLFNLLVTNVPGPQVPLYVLRRRLLHAYPVAFLPSHHALAIAIMSYDGEMNFGLLGDFEAVDDIEEIGRSVVAELATLVALAKESTRSTDPTAPAPVAKPTGPVAKPARRPARTPTRT